MNEAMVPFICLIAITLTFLSCSVRTQNHRIRKSKEKFDIYHVDINSPNSTRTSKKSADFYKRVYPHDAQQTKV
ncbi:unnamed protein product [Acanthoscelides obtectus]|uniref:Secreted protein n=1 Tax=Acanthoscelides obtectus TaxID=200917 RepID=A0A9P0NW58_ACAOB|nr:unnamed protein product [Acanthoscelides obtectus]CAK1654997.1 hypothetical protein AOBTE_LOCUS18951 [Acanthoscelides obtectus]